MPRVALLMVSQVSICYLFAGLSKLNVWWFSGGVLADNMHVSWPTWTYPVLAAVVVPTEIFIGVGMWFRRTRLTALALGVALHFSIVFLLEAPYALVTFSFVCFAVYPLAWQAPCLPDLAREMRTRRDRVPRVATTIG